MTKQEVLNSASESHPCDIYDSPVTEKAALKAMEEYGRQRGIEFAEWMGRNFQMVVPGFKWLPIDEKIIEEYDLSPNELYPTAELYAIFYNP